MKRLSSFVVIGLIVAAGCAAWHVSAQPPAGRAALRDPLADWLYPGATKRAESNGERLASIPLHGIHLKTTDPIDTVFLFYRKKSEPGLPAAKEFAWQPRSQFALLLTQFAQGGQSGSYFYFPRKEADSSLLIVHQPERTITVQISCDPQAPAITDIFLVADEH